jgi:hypothetical protein
VGIYTSNFFPFIFIDQIMKPSEIGELTVDWASVQIISPEIFFFWGDLVSTTTA